MWTWIVFHKIKKYFKLNALEAIYDVKEYIRFFLKYVPGSEYNYLIYENRTKNKNLKSGNH